MTFKKHLVFVLSVLLAVLSQLSLTIAGEIPGYVGQQSFRLQDDSQLFELTRRTEDLKVEIARIDQARDQIAQQIRNLEADRNNIQSKMEDIHRTIEGQKVAKAGLESKLAELNKAPDVNKDAIAATQAEISSTDSSIQQNAQAYGALKLQLGPFNVKIDQTKVEYDVAQRRSQEASGRLQAAARERESYRQDLIAAIQSVNNQGARSGLNDGSHDGAMLARRAGQDRGSREGEADGFAQGTTDGQNRYYRMGADQGEKDGASRARINGERDGTEEGIDAGNSNAGDREGEIAGSKRGDASNAAAVGIEQGKKAGLERAVRTGTANGNAKGEDETVKKLESGDLNSVNLGGAYIGSFQRRSPDYPGDFNGQSFSPNISNSREVIRKAYTDGYVDQYREYTRYEYLRRIDGEYNASYDSYYANAYKNAANREYPEHYNAGRSEADARAYSRDYPVVKAQAYNVAFEATDANPSRSSAEYKSAYKSSELAAYNQRYEAIRSANFSRVELEVFNANIAAQTEIYRQKRIAEVTAVYNSNAILAFVSSDMFDGGINGIAKLDGIYQPGEATLHSVTLRNFGFKPAKNVSVQLDNGSAVLLPEIPARSLVLVKGAGMSQISQGSSIGSTAKTSLKVLAKLTSSDAVEAQHFDSINGGVLKSSDAKAVKVQYPLSLSSLSLSSQLLKGVANKLSVGVTNNSKRPYVGELKIQVIANSQSALLSKEFKALDGLATTAQLSDAEVLVTNDADIYRNLSFSATISQSGITLGVLSSDMVAMAKAQYAEKSKAAVIVANSDKNLNQLLDALSLAGGTEKVSVLDLSLASINAATISSGLNQKVLLVVDDAAGTNIKSLNTFVAKSKSSSFVFIDESASGLKNAQTLAASKDAQKLLWDKKSVVFTNPHRAEGVLKSSAMIQSSLNAFDKDLALASDLTLSASELIARFKSEVNRTSFFTANNAIKIFSLKALSEVLTINKAYDESGGVFSRDKKWAEMIGNDNTLFINALKSATSGDITEEKLSTILPSISMRETLSAAMRDSSLISRNMMPKIANATNKVLDNMDDGYKKSLKSFNKDLYNKSYEKASIHRPFFIEEPAEQ